MNKLDEAKQYLDRSLQIQQRISSDIHSDCGVSITLNELGRCLTQMNKLDEAKQYLDRSLQIKQRISSDVDSDYGVSITLQELGRCLMQMNNSMKQNNIWTDHCKFNNDYHLIFILIVEFRLHLMSLVAV